MKMSRLFLNQFERFHQKKMRNEEEEEETLVGHSFHRFVLSQLTILFYKFSSLKRERECTFSLFLSLFVVLLPCGFLPRSFLVIMMIVLNIDPLLVHLFEGQLS